MKYPYGSIFLKTSKSLLKASGHPVPCTWDAYPQFASQVSNDCSEAFPGVLKAELVSVLCVTPNLVPSMCFCYYRYDTG